VDIDPGQIGKNIMPDLGICADAKTDPSSPWSRKSAPQRQAAAYQTRHLPDPGQDGAKNRLRQHPIQTQRVFKEINEFFDEETVFVTCIGLNQIWSGQLQKISKPRHYLDCGGAGPLGWDMPASIGAKVARPDKVVVDVVGDFGFQFCMDALPVAVMYKVPFVIVVLNNGYLGLIRQAEKYMYDMNFEVQIWYDSLRAIQAEQAPMAVASGGRGAVNVERAAQVAENEAGVRLCEIRRSVRSIRRTSHGPQGNQGRPEKGR